MGTAAKPGKKHRVLLVDDHTIMREGVKVLLINDGSFDVVGEADDGRVAKQMVAELMPDLILTDLSMPHTNGTEAIIDIKQRFPTVRIVVLTMHNSEEHIRATLHAGANGYVLKDDSSAELLAAVHNVAAGKTYLSPSICNKVVSNFVKSEGAAPEQGSWEQLTHREREVIKLVAEGARNRDIATYLCLSEKTVEKHRSNLMRKLNLHCAAQLTAYAIRNGLIPQG